MRRAVERRDGGSGGGGRGTGGSGGGGGGAREDAALAALSTGDLLLVAAAAREELCGDDVTAEAMRAGAGGAWAQRWPALFADGGGDGDRVVARLFLHACELAIVDHFLYAGAATAAAGARGAVRPAASAVPSTPPLTPTPTPTPTLSPRSSHFITDGRIFVASDSAEWRGALDAASAAWPVDDASAPASFTVASPLLSSEIATSGTGGASVTRTAPEGVANAAADVDDETASHPHIAALLRAAAAAPTSAAVVTWIGGASLRVHRASVTAADGRSVERRVIVFSEAAPF